MKWQDKKPAVIGNMLKFVAPGTPMRQGIDNVLRAKTGGLIVLDHSKIVGDLLDGGFKIDAPFTPSNLYELAKMDGAIVLNHDASTILYANVQLTPDATILSKETGMRHRTAERVAKQTGALVIAISERRNVITLYKGNLRYALKEMGVILTKANQAMQTLEKYRIVLEQSLTNLGALEFEDLVTMAEITQVVHRVEMVLRIKMEILNYINELGVEGRLIQLQLTELISNMEIEAALLMKDYSKRKTEKPEELLKEIQESSSMELMNDQEIIKLLGYPLDTKMEDVIYPRGYRILNKIPRLPKIIIEYIVNRFETLQETMKASPADLVQISGVGEIRAEKIKEGLNRIQEQLFIDRHI